MLPCTMLDQCEMFSFSLLGLKFASQNILRFCLICVCYHGKKKKVTLVYNTVPMTHTTTATTCGDITPSLLYIFIFIN